MTQELLLEEGPRVLLIDDDAAVRDLIGRRLDALGCVVTAVDAAEEGIVEAGETAFDVVVADIHLPGLSGIELASFLLSQNPDLPVVLMTGDRDEELAREALSRGPVQYLLKPFEPFEIEAAVRKALGRQGWTATEESMGTRPAGDPAAGPPVEWLRFVDHESWAGPGHGGRVAEIAAALRGCMPEAMAEIDLNDLVLAARTHEVGRLNQPDAEGPTVAMQSAELLAEAGFPRVSVRAVRHMHERWDGAGGPEGLAGLHIPLAGRILAAADALDHYVSAWLHAGLNPDNAVDRAIHLVAVQQEQIFCPEVVAAVHDATETVREICTPAANEGTTDLTTASFVNALAGVSFQAA